MMASRVASVGIVGSGPSTKQWHLVRKVFLLFLLLTAAALGLFILFRRNTNVSPFVFGVFADASLGILSGFGSRLILRKRHWLLRALAATSLSIVGLVILGYLSAARLGVGPVDLGWVRVSLPDGLLFLSKRRVELPVPISPGRMDLQDVAHLMVALDASWLALRAWNRKGSGLSMSHASAAVPKLASGEAKLRMSRPGSSGAQLWVAPAENFRVEQASVSAAGVSPVPRPRLSRRLESGAVGRHRKVGRPLVTPARPVRGGSRRRGVLRHRPDVRLATVEKHRCPYCLEDIKQNDRRGTVECPVCHTLHHKDCWDITGTCQVPHLNT